MKDFIQMGGYAFYVWTSYALAFVILLLNVLLPMRQQQKLLREIEHKVARLKRGSS